VCTLAILLSRQTGLIKNLAPFDPVKAKKCVFNRQLHGCRVV
jgi:hypothetical protein